MPRAKGSGGARQGMPGQSYANRSDLNMDHAPEGVGPNGEIRTAAAGSMEAPPDPGMYPDDTPNVGGPTRFPDEPVTAGLQPRAGSIQAQDAIDVGQIKSYLPALTASASMPNIPPSFVRFVQALRNAPNA